MKKFEMFVKNECKKIAKEYFGLDFNIPIKFSNKMSNKMGYFRHTATTPMLINFSNKLATDFEFEEALGIIKHEVCHWALFVKKEQYRDKTPHFEQELVRIGGITSGVIKTKGEMFKLVCEKCGRTLRTYNSQNKAVSAEFKYQHATWRCCHVKGVYGGSIQGIVNKTLLQYIDEIVPMKVVVKEKKENKKTDKKVAKEVANKFLKKPAQRVKDVFEQIKHDRVVIEKLKNESYCKELLKLNYAFLSETNENEKRYYKKQVEVNGKQLFMCNDLYEKNAEAFEDFLGYYLSISKTN